MNQKERKELAQWAMEKAIKAGANESAVTIRNNREVEIEYRDKQLDKLKESTQNSLDLNLYVDHKYSSHSTNDLRKETLNKFISEAVAMTKYLAKDKYRSLPESKYYPTAKGKDLDILDPDYDKVDAPKRLQIAKEIEAAAMQESDKIISVTSSYSDTFTKLVKAQSNGFLGETERTTFVSVAEATVDDGEGGRPDAYSYAVTRYLSDMPDTEALGKEAVKRASRKIGQKKMESGKYTMVVENRAGRRLLGMFNTPLSGRGIQQKQSFLDGMKGKQIASEKLTAIDDPSIKKGLGSRHFDGEGLAAVKRPIIENGVLRNYFIDTYYGKKLEMEPTTGGASNLVFASGNQSPDEILKSLDKAIWVTGFIGGNSNNTTGDFSYGIMGQYIENGKIVHPVNEMNISGNALEFWKHLIEVGNDPFEYSSWRVPTMVFEGVEFSGL